MSIERICAVAGFCYMLMATTVFSTIILGAWVQGQTEVTIMLNEFSEQKIELFIFTLGQFLVPITVYKFERVLFSKNEG